MPTNRKFVTCNKCGSNCIGRYNDEQGNPLCNKCCEQHKRLVSCIVCGSGHYDMLGDNTCNKCRQLPSDTHRCPTCNRAMRTVIADMSECMTCIGKPKYWRLLRAHRKQVISKGN